MTDTSGGAPAPAAPTYVPTAQPAQQKSTLRDLAPWTVLGAVVVAGVVARSLGAFVAVYQLLGTVAGVCGGYVAGRKSGDGTTVTTTAGDPPSTQVRS